MADSRRGDQGLFSRLRRLFLTGLVIILPLLITIWLLRVLFGLVHGVSTPFILRILSLLRVPLVDDPAFSTYLAPLIGVSVTLVLILMVGALLRPAGDRRKMPGFTLVFLPTTPNPTSGWLATVPNREIIPLNMSIEDDIKTIVNSELVLPPDWDRS